MDVLVAFQYRVGASYAFQRQAIGGVDAGARSTLTATRLRLPKRRSTCSASTRRSARAVWARTGRASVTCAPPQSPYTAAGAYVDEAPW